MVWCQLWFLLVNLDSSSPQINIHALTPTGTLEYLPEYIESEEDPVQKLSARIQLIKTFWILWCRVGHVTWNHLRNPDIGHHKVRDIPVTANKNREAVEYHNNEKVDQCEPGCVWLAGRLKRQFSAANSLGLHGIIEFEISHANRSPCHKTRN